MDETLPSTPPTFTAFAQHKRIATGPLPDVLPVLKARFNADRMDDVLVFRDDTGEQIDFDLRGTLDEVLRRSAPASPAPEDAASPPAPRGPGRPKLGVVSREVTLLPRHWEWLDAQPQGASAALRRLVEQAKKKEPHVERARRLRAGLSRFLSAMAGNFPNYEESTRALFAGDHAKLVSLIKKWPKDIREHVARLSEQSLSPAP